MRNILIVTLLSLPLFFVFNSQPLNVLAQPEPLQLQIPLDVEGESQGQITLCEGETGTLSCNGISRYIAAVYSWGVVAVSVFAVLAIVYGGVLYITSRGSQGQLKKAREVMGGAITGLILTLGSYTILYVINPDLVQFRSLTLRSIEPYEIVIHPILQETSDLSSLEIDPNPSGCQDGYILYKQGDPRWRNDTMGNGSRLGPAGCGITSMANIIGNHGKNATPKILAGESHQIRAGTNTAWDRVAKFLAPKYDYPVTPDINMFGSAGAQKARQKLENCHMIMTSIKNYQGRFRNGHFITLYAMDGNSVKVLDSSSANIVRMPWSDVLRYQTVPGGWFSDFYPDEGNRCGQVNNCTP